MATLPSLPCEVMHVMGGEELEVQNVQVRFSKERMERGGRGIGKINRFGVNMSLG